ncbi:MAG: holo-ACP synthase [Lachnospiraceae bacterium]|nr:holo-ACP synthase [Lachnospiraceae bacterium]
MIKGIGNDLTEIARVADAVQKEAFRNHCYTSEEIAFCKDRAVLYADNFAAKEAVAKALGTGFSGFGPREIEVLRDGRGRPFVRLFGGAKERMEELGITNIHVSISNTAELSFATAVAETVESQRP